MERISRQRRFPASHMSNNYLVPVDELGYDPKDEASVIEYAKRLLGKSLNQALGTTHTLNTLKHSQNKGAFGEILEELYFHIKKNSDPVPDIPECGIEIKTGRFKTGPKAGKSVDQRLKLGSIDYFNSFTSSTLFDDALWIKTQKILLLMLVRNQNNNRMDEICDYADKIIFPAEDIAQFARDWLTIKQYVTSGRADELSEGHTNYLAACTSGSGKGKLVDAPIGHDCAKAANIQAKERAFCFKEGYLNVLLGLRKKKQKLAKIVISKNNSLEETVIAQLETFYNITCSRICADLRIDPSRAVLSKARYYLIAKMVTGRILALIADQPDVDIGLDDYEQFNKADIKIKTISLESDFNINEHMSFPAINWVKLHNESMWEESELYKQMTRRYLFVVFQKHSSGDVLSSVLMKAFFWTMTAHDLRLMESLWNDTKRKVANDDYSHFISISDDRVGHVRPHDKKGLRNSPTPQGDLEKKMSFWINKSYIHKLIMSRLA